MGDSLCWVQVGGRSRGFTIIEVICVILIMGILGAVVATRLTSSTTYELKTQAEVLKSHLRYAQARAMNSNVIWGIAVSANSYSLFNSNPGSSPELPGLSSNTAPLPSGMTISDSLGTGVVAFDTWGKPYKDLAALDAQLVDRTISLGLGGEVEVISISRNTGFIP